MSVFFEIYLSTMVGILLSILLPILVRVLPESVGGSLASGKSKMMRIWEVIWPYLATGIFSALTALLVVAFLGDQLKDWRAGLLAGYSWDSTIQKLRKQ
jgi:hypothetical protein